MRHGQLLADRDDADCRLAVEAFRSGSAILTVEFQMTELNRDLELHFDLLRRKVYGRGAAAAAGVLRSGGLR